VFATIFFGLVLQSIETSYMNTGAVAYKQQATKLLPSITFYDGVLNIIGRSIPHDSNILYNPLIKVFYQYSLEPHDKTEINIKLDYLNSESNRQLLNVLIIAEKINRRGKNVLIKWHYKPTDLLMLEQGGIFKAIVDVPFSFEPVS
jgi:hypothetical protein